MSDTVRLNVTSVIDGREYSAVMPYPRQCWDDVDEYDREQLRVICRYRFGHWVREETGVQLPDERLDALPVTPV